MKGMVFQSGVLVAALTGAGFAQTTLHTTTTLVVVPTLVQTGGIARGQFASYVNLETMLASLLGGAPNKVSIVNFDSRPEAASPFTSNVAEWRDAIDHPDQGDSGAAIFDGISFALDLLKKEPVGNRRAILLISQEHD